MRWHSPKRFRWPRTKPIPRLLSPPTAAIHAPLLAKAHSGHLSPINTSNPLFVIETAADTVELKRRAVPTAFTLDTENRKLIGQLWQMPFDQGWYNPIVRWGLDDDSYEVIPVPADFPYCGMFVLDSSRNEIFCPGLSGDHLQITAFDIDRGTKRLVIGFNLGLDPEEWSFANVTEMKLSANRASLYLMLDYCSAVSHDNNKTVIYRYDFSDGRVTRLIDRYTQSGAKVAASAFALADSGILAINAEVAGDIGGDDHLLLIDYDGQDITDVSVPFEMVLTEIEISEGSDTAYAAGYRGIAKTDIISGSQQILFAETEEPLFNIAQLGSVAIDEAASRLLVGDTGYGYIFAVDLASYTMSGVFSSPDIDTPVDVELDSTSGMMYVLAQATGELYSYIPATGESALLLDYCQEDAGRNAMSTDIGTVQGLDFDPLNPWIWISGDYLMRFDLETKTCSVMPWKYYGYGLVDNISILDTEATFDGKLFGTKFNNLIQIDFESGELVTNSR